MSRRSDNSRSVWDTLLIVAVAALAVTFGHAQQALAAQDEADGRVVEISPNDDGLGLEEHAEDQVEPAVPAYWLGIEGGPLDSPILRTHLQLADDVGVVVRQVMPGSPAEKAGLKEHDILIAVGGDQIVDMGTLQNAVVESQAKPLELKVLRLAKELTITVTPEERPKDLPAKLNFGGGAGGMGFNFQDMPHGEHANEAVREALKQLQGNNPFGGLRVFGPGMILNGQRLEQAALPGGVAVTITRDGDGPAKITVKKGDDTWTVEGNDQEALKQLPEDVRPFVKQMLQGSALGQGGGMHQFHVQGDLENPFGNFDFAAPGPQGDRVGQRILDRLEQLEKQFDRLERRFHGENSQQGTNPADDPSKT